MELVFGVLVLAAVVVVLALLCHCCRRRNQGQIISRPPPMPPGPAVNAPYPQQQYTIPYNNAMASPAPYPVVYPMPVAGAPGASVGAPAAHMPMPLPSQPTAPIIAHAPPPSYEQAMGAKDLPYNPHHPH